MSGVPGWHSAVAAFVQPSDASAGPSDSQRALLGQELPRTFRSSLSMTKSNALYTQVERALRQDDVDIVECKIKSAEGADGLAASTWPRCASGPLLSADCC